MPGKMSCLLCSLTRPCWKEMLWCLASSDFSRGQTARHRRRDAADGFLRGNHWLPLLIRTHSAYRIRFVYVPAADESFKSPTARRFVVEDRSGEARIQNKHISQGRFLFFCRLVRLCLIQTSVLFLLTAAFFQNHHLNSYRTESM